MDLASIEICVRRANIPAAEWLEHKGAMVELLRMPTTELRRVHVASDRLVEVAKSLSQIAAETTDETVKADLYSQIEKILDSVSVANGAIRAVTGATGPSR